MHVIESAGLRVVDTDDDDSEGITNDDAFERLLRDAVSTPRSPP